MLKKLVVIAGSILVLLMVAYLFFVSTGKPIGTDLGVIGQGKPAIVLAYENYSPAGGEALSVLRKVRSGYDSRLEFVVADVGTPAGRNFADRHQLRDGLAVFLDQDGKARQVTRIPSQESDVNQLLDSLLGSVE